MAGGQNPESPNPSTNLGGGSDGSPPSAQDSAPGHFSVDENVTIEPVADLHLIAAGRPRLSPREGAPQVTTWERRRTPKEQIIKEAG